MKKTIAFMMMISLLGKITGFLREAGMASQIGANALTDAYVFATTISGLFAFIILEGLNSALIPVLSQAEIKGEQEVFFRRILTISLVVLLGFTLFLFFFSDKLLYIFAPGISGEIRELTEKFAKILSINVLFIGIQGLFVGYLQKNNRFLHVSAMAFPLNFAILTGIFLSSPTNIYPLVVGTAIGQILTALWLLIPLKKTGFKYSWDFDLNDEYIRLFSILVLPVLLSMTATQINLVVDRALASLLPEASASYLSYASKIQNLFNAVFVVSIASVLFKSQAEYAADRNYKKVFEITRNNLQMVMLFVIPAVAGLMFLSTDVIKLAFMRNQFLLKDAIVTGKVLFIYAGLILFQTLGDMLSRLYFALKEAKKPVVATTLAVVINIILNFILIKYMGIYGLALATLIASCSRVLILVAYVHSDPRFEGKLLFGFSLVHFFIGSGVMSLCLWAISNLSFIGNLSTFSYLLISFVVGIFSYILYLYIAKVEEFRLILRGISAYLHRR